MGAEQFEEIVFSTVVLSAFELELQVHSDAELGIHADQVCMGGEGAGKVRNICVVCGIGAFCDELWTWFGNGNPLRFGEFGPLLAHIIPVSVWSIGQLQRLLQREVIDDRSSLIVEQN